MTLQMATIGSKASLKRGVWLHTDFGQTDNKSYFDIANIDKYDIILGTPFMEQHNMLIGFGTHRCLKHGNGQTFEEPPMVQAPLKGKRQQKANVKDNSYATITEVPDDIAKRTTVEASMSA